jgi:hypothetical protein
MKKLILSLFLTLFLLSGCKTKEMIRYVPINSIVYKIDSVEILKTDSFREYVKGDTLYRDRWKTLYKFHERLQHDTIMVPYEVRVDVPVEKIIIKTQKDAVWWIGLIVSIGGLLFLLYKIIK